MSNELYHYGTPKHSGRYPWGSGNNPYHHGESAPSWWKNRRVRKDFKVYRKSAENYAQDTKDAVSADKSVLYSKYRQQTMDNLSKSGSKFIATDKMMSTKYSDIEMHSSVVSSDSGREFVNTIWKDKASGNAIVYDSKPLKRFSGRRVKSGGTAAYKEKRKKEVAAGTLGLVSASATAIRTLT